MSNLQALHDYYLTTKPNTGKVQYASKFLIRLCRHLNLDTPEDITPQYYGELPAVIDEYYQNDIHKAIQDKSMLAEMIGRYGPTDGWEKALAALLKDKDENLRQFSFQSLEYFALRDPKLVLQYIDKYKDSDDFLMLAVAARVMSKMYTPENKSILENAIDSWKKSGSVEFLKELKRNIQKCIRKEEKFTKEPGHQDYFQKLTKLIE